MVYDGQPIVDHFRRIEEGRTMGAMTVRDDDRIAEQRLLPRGRPGPTGRSPEGSSALSFCRSPYRRRRWRSASRAKIESACVQGVACPLIL